MRFLHRVRLLVSVFLFLMSRATRCYYTFAPHHHPALSLSPSSHHIFLLSVPLLPIAFVYLHSIVSYERYIIIYALAPPRLLSHLFLAALRIVHRTPHPHACCYISLERLVYHRNIPCVHVSAFCHFSCRHGPCSAISRDSYVGGIGAVPCCIRLSLRLSPVFRRTVPHAL